MKICLVAPGIMPIPPTKWGAVEMLLWDYYQILSNELGIEVKIINTKDRFDILKQIHAENFDVVHIHYDVYVDITKQIFGPKIIMSSHYPFINVQSQHKNDGYDSIFKELISNNNFYIFASSKKDIDTFISSGVDGNKIFHSRLGIRKNDYEFNQHPTYDKTFCFSQIVDRKRQYLIQSLEDIVFSGRLDDSRFVTGKNYLGELHRDVLNKEITKYSNFILLSKTENTTPLAVKEALLCGLGVVVSKEVAVELDEREFITVLDEEQIRDINVIRESIFKNREISKRMRNQIR
jgi:hypothetical protein